MKNSPSCAHVLHKTLNLVISRCCFAKKDKAKKNVPAKFKTHEYRVIAVAVTIMRELISNDDGDGNENVKKAIGFITKTAS